MHPPRAILVSVIVLIALAAGLVALEYGKLTRGYYAQAAFSEGRSARDRLNLLLSAPLSVQNLTSKLISREGSDGPDLSGVEMLLVSALADEQSIGSATVLDSQGVLAMASRVQPGVLLYLRPQSGQQGKLTLLGTDAAPVGPASVKVQDIAEHGRALADALKARGPSWPAWVVSNKVPGQKGATLTSVVPAGPDGSESLLLAISFSLDTIQEVLAQGMPGEARVLVFTADGHVLNPGVGRGLGQGETHPQALFVGSDKASDPVVSAALAAWMKLGRLEAEAFSYQVEGRAWWACLSALTDNPESTRVGLALSQDAMLGLLFEGRAAPLAIGAGLFAALALLIFLAVQSRRRGKAFSASFYESEPEIRELLAKGEGERLEFKSTLRFNLAAGKPGKEIELATLKTLTAFMNTDGGLLAVGVDDQGQALGLEADGFSNDDHVLRHFSSLFAQHIGVEFLPYVTFALRSLDGRKLLLVECKSCKEPVILRCGKEEEFYVRAGPSSRKLSLSEFMRRVTGKNTTA